MSVTFLYASGNTKGKNKIKQRYSEEKLHEA